MRDFKISEPVSEFNYAVEIEYGFFGEDLIRSEFFGTAKDAAAFLDAFDYENGDVFGMNGDGATMHAVESYRRESAFAAIPGFITEFNTNDGTSEIIGADQFHNLRRMFRKDRANYRIHRFFADGAKVYAVMFIGDGDARLSSYVWHVPFGSDELY